MMELESFGVDPNFDLEMLVDHAEEYGKDLIMLSPMIGECKLDYSEMVEGEIFYYFRNIKQGYCAESYTEAYFDQYGRMCNLDYIGDIKRSQMQMIFKK